MSDVIHLPGFSPHWPNVARPACGARRGVMTLEVDGLRTVHLGASATPLEIGRVTQPLVSCRKCIDSALMRSNPYATATGNRWRCWLLAMLNGRTPDADTGSTYMARLRRDDDAPLSP